MKAWKGQEHVVRKSKFTEDQIAFALKQTADADRAAGVIRLLDGASYEASLANSRAVAVIPSGLA